MITTPLVDVFMPTYNHAPFLAQAIESVLAQKTNFAYRLNIADDCSTDGAQAIIKQYADQYADRIRAILSPDHVGILHQDRLSVRVLQACTGKYLAVLEGDDYWSAPDKLQKQVDFLEGHKDFAICFHAVKSVNEKGDELPDLSFVPQQKRIFTIEDLLAGNFIHACSVMFRGGLVKEFPDWYTTLRIGDWPLHVMHAQHGKIGYLDEVMAVYRVHERSLWSSRDRLDQITETMAALDHLDAYLGFKYRKTIKASKARRLLELAETYYLRGRLSEARVAVIKSLRCSGFRNWPALNLFFRLQAPDLYARLLTLRNLRSVK
jgi:glycosyltransferase involved in cell wall biosynthesis